MATQVEILMRTEGGPSAAGPGGGAPSSDQTDTAKATKEGTDATKDQKDEAKKQGKSFNDKFGGFKKFIRSNLGLQFGLSSILKQSQVFTSFIGVIFQLIGALVDVMLAPLLPILMGVIRIAAGAIPWFQARAEQFAKWLEGAIRSLSDWYQSILPWLEMKWTEFTDAWGGGWVEVAKLIWEWIWGGIKWVTGWVLFTALPWLWETAKSWAEGVWDWFMEQPTRIKGWIITSLMFGWNLITGMIKFLWGAKGAILKFGLRWGGKLLGFLIKLPFRLLGFGFKILGKLIKILLPGIGHVIVLVGKLAGLIVKGIMRAAWAIVKFLFGLAGKLVKWVVKGAMDAGKGLIKTLLDNFIPKLSKLPLVGGIFKSLSKVGSVLSVVAKASKAIPVLGSVATLGFGVAETISNTRKYGWQAGVATAGKTLAATTLAATGNTVASLAVDIGGSMLIDKLAKSGKLGTSGTHFQPGGEGYKGPPIVVKTTIVAENGSTIQEEQTQNLKDGETATSNVTNVLQAASGSP